MEKKLYYSFDDEPVSKFYYEIDKNKIEIYFNGYFDINKDMYIEKPCVWTIENWKEAKCKIGNDLKLYNLNNSISIFNLILYMKLNEEFVLEMLVNTLDNRYLTLFFKEPILHLK